MYALRKPEISLHDRTLPMVAALTVLVLAIVFSPTPAMAQLCVGPCITVNGGPLGTDSPDHPSTHGQQAGRLVRDTIASTCAAPKICPGLFGVDPRAYDAYEFDNPNDFTICVEVTVTTGCGFDLFTVAYLDTFDPTDLCLNYLADSGSSGDAVFSFEVPPLSNFIVVVHEVTAGVGCADYSLNSAVWPARPISA